MGGRSSQSMVRRLLLQPADRAAAAGVLVALAAVVLVVVAAAALAALAVEVLQEWGRWALLCCRSPRQWLRCD